MMKQLIFRLPSRLMFLVVGLMLSLGAFAQITVNGHVKDATGEDIIGATVRIVGQQGGTVTDFNGNFQLKAKAGAELQISSIGYQTATVKAAAQVEVILQDDAKVLDQVVVIGYGVAKKNDLTGSVTAIKPDDKNHGLQTSAQDMLQGKVAGVNIVNDGGSPGGGATIRIRGGSSLNASNDPLIVIDGLSMDTYGRKGSANFLASINPNDIESFTVLKDASATAIYGSRASNGVIIITTKKGRKGSAPKINYNGNVSISKVKNTVDVLDANEYMAFVKKTVMATKGYTEAEYEASNEYKNLGYYDANGNHLFANTDWQDEIYRTAFSTDHNVSITGGLKNMPYRVSFGMTDQNGVLKKSSYQRYTASFNVSPSFFDDHLTLNVNGKYMFSHSDYSNGDAIGNAVSYDPTKPVYNNTDFYKKNWNGFQQWSVPTDYKDPNWLQGPNTLAPGNPVAAIYNKVDKGRQHSYIGNFEADYKIHGFEDLHLHMNAGADMEFGRNTQEFSPYYFDTSKYYYGQTGWSSMRTSNVSLQLYAQYLHDFGKDHSVNAMAGYEYQRFHKNTDWFNEAYYPSTNLEKPGQPYAANCSAGAQTRYRTENILVSFFGRFNYTFKDRYLFTFTIRDDGSSRFSKDNRWGIFPAAAFAWKINEEKFIKNIDWISDFKLRLGWGMTGQQEGISDYPYLVTYTPNQNGAFYPILGNGNTYRPDAYNADLTWEKTTTWNGGIDFGILNQRFTASLDVYYRKTTDLINNVTLSVGSNFSNKINSNIGSLHNFGIEGALSGNIIETKDFTWNLGYNVTWNKNKIDELVGGDESSYRIPYGGLPIGDKSTDGIKAYHVGQAVSTYFVYQQVYDEKGEPIRGCYVDRDHNGVINDGDRYYYKKADPDVTMGLTSKFIYKNWDLSFSMRANFNNYVYNAVEASNANLSLSSLYSGAAWHGVVDMDLQKNWTAAGAKDVLSDYFIQNASFLKLDNITLGYSFDRLFHNGSFSGLSGRIYATAQNVLTVTKYKGLDPEVNGGYDSNIYPRPFTGILGISLNF